MGLAESLYVFNYKAGSGHSTIVANPHREKIILTKERLVAGSKMIDYCSQRCGLQSAGLVEIKRDAEKISLGRGWKQNFLLVFGTEKKERY